MKTIPGYVALIARGASMRYPVIIRFDLIDVILPVLGQDESLLILTTGREIELDEKPVAVMKRIEEARTEEEPIDKDPVPSIQDHPDYEHVRGPWFRRQRIG